MHYPFPGNVKRLADALESHLDAEVLADALESRLAAEVGEGEVAAFLSEWDKKLISMTFTGTGGPAETIHFACQIIRQLLAQRDEARAATEAALTERNALGSERDRLEARVKELEA
jgi:hypothetical protein